MLTVRQEKCIVTCKYEKVDLDETKQELIDYQAIVSSVESSVLWIFCPSYLNNF